MRADNADRLLSRYLFWGIASVSVFIVFIVILLVAMIFEETGTGIYFVLLLAGFLWIGFTSVSRHIYVMLKRLLGKEISVMEFLATQLVVLLLPFFYHKLSKEVRLYRDKGTGDKTAKRTE